MNMYQYEDYDYVNQEELSLLEEDNVVPFEKPVEKSSKRRKPAKRIEFDVKVVDEGKSEFQFRGFMPPLKGAVALLGVLGVGTILGILITLSIV